MNEADRRVELEEILEFCQESQRRCEDVRRRLVNGQISDAEAITAYAVATAPLAAAMKRLSTLRAPA